MASACEIGTFVSISASISVSNFVSISASNCASISASIMVVIVGSGVLFVPASAGVAQNTDRPMSASY